MSAQYSGSVLTQRCYQQKVRIFKRLILAGNRRDQRDAIIANELLDLVNTALFVNHAGTIEAIDEVAAIVCPIVGKALRLSANGSFPNQLSIEDNIALCRIDLQDKLAS
jgi:hypothetical protein